MPANARMPRQRASKPRADHTRERLWLVTVIPELVPSPCIARGVDVPGSTQDCNMRGPREGSLAEPTMLWPFNHFRKPRTPHRGTIEAIYGMIVTQAREPLFHRALGVPDTVNGRFDLLLMHLWLVLRRLKSADGGKELSQA